eukprot:228818_1
MSQKHPHNNNWICSQCAFSDHPSLSYCEKCDFQPEQKMHHTQQTQVTNNQGSHYNGWKCYRCDCKNHSAMPYCEHCLAPNNRQMIKIEDTMEIKLAKLYTEFENKLSNAPTNYDLEIKVKYNNSRCNCPACDRRKTVQIFKMGELGVTLKRDEYKKEVIVERVQKHVKVCFFKFKTKDETNTKVIESHRWKEVELICQSDLDVFHVDIL